jgi:hypothetical protein
MEQSMYDGISAELEGIDLGDKRLNKRSKTIIETFAADPQASINAACDGWAETQAAYRFFDNANVSPEKILKPHIEATKERIKTQPVVLLVQDTTELDFTAHPSDDLRCLNKFGRFGLYDHTHLAITPDKLSLGIIGQELYDRDPDSLGKTKERRNLPIEEKESMRWLTGYRMACELSAECPETTIVSVCDSEADIYDIFVESQQHDTPAEFIIRGKEDRCTPERDLESGPRVYRKVRDEVSASKVRTTRTIKLSQTPKRKAREAELEIRAMSVTVKPPHARSHLPSVNYNVVLVKEVNGPGDGTDVCWLLLTTLPVETTDEIFLVIDYYVARWAIEEYFRTMKTGCRVEDIQLEKVSRLKNCLALYKIITWRVMHVTYLSRTNPSASCASAFSESEWQSVWCVTNPGEKIPSEPPTLGTFFRLLAQLGGYNNRSNERPAGPQTVWIGIRRMTDFAIAWMASQKQ